MPQQDIVLRVPMCTFDQIVACEDPASHAKVMKPGSYNEFEQVQDNPNGSRPKYICEVAVPGGCPRIQCYHESPGTPFPNSKFQACRMQGLIQSEKNADGFWMKLPCSQCPEIRKLHPTTEAFVYGEDAGRN